MARAALVLVFVVGCGARSGLEVWPAEPVDAGRDASAIDAPLDAPGTPLVDAPVPSTCPPPSDFGFMLVRGDTITRDAPYGEISLGGDGTTVVLAAELLGGGDLAIVTSSLDGRGMEVAGTHTAYSGIFRPRASVVGGVARVFGDESGVRGLHLVTPGVPETMRTRFIGGSLVEYDRPVWNGSRLVVAGERGSEGIFVGEFLPGRVATEWRRLRDGPWDVHAAADPSTGTTSVFYRDTDARFRVETLDAEGVALAPLGGTVLEGEAELGAATAFGLLEDGSAQPWVVASFTIDPDGTFRARLRRFRADGSAGGGFSTPLAEAPAAIDLTTVAPAHHRSGYGMIASDVSRRVLFHGAGEDFVGDARDVPMSCDPLLLSIASGPCGYVLACVAPGGSAVHTALAIPPLPR